MDGRDAVQEAERLWLPCRQDKRCTLHWLLLSGPTLPTGPHGLGLGQLTGFGAEGVTGKTENKASG